MEWKFPNEMVDEIVYAALPVSWLIWEDYGCDINNIDIAVDIDDYDLIGINDCIGFRGKTLFASLQRLWEQKMIVFNWNFYLETYITNDGETEWRIEVTAKHATARGIVNGLV